MSAFKGMILGVEYTDRAQFEKAVRGAGHRFGMVGRSGDWRVGRPVKFRTADGISYSGQVWAKGATRGTVILALDGGKYARVTTQTSEGNLIDSRGNSLSTYGRVSG